MSDETPDVEGTATPPLEENETLTTQMANAVPSTSSPLTIAAAMSSSSTTLSSSSPSSSSNTCASSSCSSSAFSSSSSDSLRRVKLYQLNEAGDWEDRGTGSVSWIKTRAEGSTSDVLVLVVRSEEDGRVQLEQPVDNAVEYQRQGDTIIAWCDSNAGSDLALSFQEVQRCQEVWDIISEAQATLRLQEDVTVTEDDSNALNASHMSAETESPDESTQQSLLPMPKRGNLAKILEKLHGITSTHRSTLSKQLKSDGDRWLRSLFTVFYEGEELEHAISCLAAFQIVKFFFLCNDQTLIDTLTQKRYIHHTVAALEYDAEVLLPAGHQLRAALFINPPNAVSKPAVEDENGKGMNEEAASEEEQKGLQKTKTLGVLDEPPVTDRLSSTESMDGMEDDLYADISVPFSFPQRRHRDFLKKVKLKLVVCVEDELTVWKIHHTQFTSYLRDVILLRHLDDPALSILSSMIYLNNVNIIQSLADNEQFMRTLFAQLNSCADLHIAKAANAQLMNGKDEKEKSATKAASTATPPSASSASDSSTSQLDDSDESCPTESAVDDSDVTAETIGLESEQDEDDTTEAEENEQSDSYPTRSDDDDRTNEKDGAHDAGGAEAFSTSSSSSRQLKRKRSRGASGEFRLSKSRKRVARVYPTVFSRTVHVYRSKNLLFLRRQTFLFLQELVASTKPLPLNLRDSVHRMLVNSGLLNVLESAMCSAPPLSDHQHHIWLACADILNSLLSHDSSIFRSWIIEMLQTAQNHGNGTQTLPEQPSNTNSSGSVTATPSLPLASVSATSSTDGSVSSVYSPSSPNLLSRLFEVLILDGVDSGLVYQLAFIVRLILDADSLSTASLTDRELFLNHIFSQHFNCLVTFLCRPMPLHASASWLVAVYHVIELLTFSAQAYSAHVKTFLVNGRLFSAMVELLALPRMEIKCAVVRFYRAIVGSKDAHYVSLMVDFGVLDPLMNMFISNGSRYNLLNSVLLELIHFITNDVVFFPLMDYLMTRHESSFNAIRYVKTFESLKTKYAELKRQREKDSDFKMQEVNDSAMQNDDTDKEQNDRNHRHILDLDDIAVAEEEDGRQESDDRHVTSKANGILGKAPPLTITVTGANSANAASAASAVSSFSMFSDSKSAEDNFDERMNEQLARSGSGKRGVTDDDNDFFEHIAKRPAMASNTPNHSAGGDNGVAKRSQTSPTAATNSTSGSVHPTTPHPQKMSFAKFSLPSAAANSSNEPTQTGSSSPMLSVPTQAKSSSGPSSPIAANSPRSPGSPPLPSLSQQHQSPPTGRSSKMSPQSPPFTAQSNNKPISPLSTGRGLTANLSGSAADTRAEQLM